MVRASGELELATKLSHNSLLPIGKLFSTESPGADERSTTLKCIP